MSPAVAGAMVVDPDAEQDGGWSGSAARFAAYGEGPDVPSPQFAAEQRVSYNQRGLGARLFALGAAGRLEQVVDVSGWAAGIDAGTAPLYFGAWLGADGGVAHAPVAARLKTSNPPGHARPPHDPPWRREVAPR